MGQLFIYLGLFIGIGIILFRLLAWIAEYIFQEKKKNSFNSTDGSGMPPFHAEPREFEIVDDKSSNVINLIFKKIPSLITMWSLGIVFSMLIGGWISANNIDRLAASAAAFEAGNTGLGLSYLWPLGRDIAKDQYRISSGKHPAIKKYGLQRHNFVYLGVNGDSHIAIMRDVVMVKDIDPSIETDDPDYAKIIIGSTVEDAQDVCRSFSDKIAVSLISEQDWKFSYEHILAKKNINRYNDYAEWFSDLDPNDSDNYKLNKKGNSAIEAKLMDGNENLADSDNGIYYDQDDVHDYVKVVYRCVAKWPKSEEE